MDSHVESARLATLRSYAVLDTADEPRFDRVTRLAAQIFGTPFAVVSLTDRDRHWFKSRCGLTAHEMSREKSFCDCTISDRQVFVVRDAFADPRFVDAPVVAGEPHIRFYAGAPLLTAEGVPLGSLCVLDPEPRAGFSARDEQLLLDLAGTVVELLEGRTRELEQIERAREMRLTTEILRHVSDAPSWGRAIEDVLQLLSAHHGAAVGSLWRLDDDGRRAALVHGYSAAAGDAEWYQAFCSGSGFDAENSLVGHCLTTLRPGWRAFARVPAGAPGAARAELMLSHGLAAHVCQPVRVDDTAFAFALLFASPVADLPKISASLDRLADALKPALQHRVSEERMRLLFAANPVPMWVYDIETLRFLEVNGAAERLYGWSREQFLGMTLLDVRPPEEVPGLRKRLADAPGDYAQMGPTVHLRADGTRMHMMAARHNIRFAGRNARLLAVWDVTEVEEARRELRLSHERLVRLAEQLRIRTEDLSEAHRIARLGTWCVHLPSRELEWSDELYRVTGQDRRYFTPTYEGTRELIHPEDQQGVQDAIDAVVVGKGQAEYEFRVLRPDGSTCHCWSTARAVVDASGEVVEVRGITQDVSLRKEAELALFRTEKLLTIGRLTGGVAHDFNNLLMVVSLNLEEVIEHLAPDDKLRDVLDAAFQATMRGKGLTSQLLSYARKQSLKPERLRLDAHLAGFTPLLQRAIGEQHALSFSAEPELWPCIVDPGQLEHAVMNLVINARDAMPAGRAIAIELANARIPTRGPRPGREEIVPGAYVKLAIADQGCGMPAYVLGRAFEPFFTTKPTGQGSGLGLSMVYGFAKQSGGHVTIDSAPGRGTRVELYFPADAEESARPPPREPAPGWRAGPRSALLVEDQEPVQRVVRRTLESLGFVVTCAGSGAEALERLERDGPFDLLFSDVVLPGAPDGVALAAEAGVRWPAMKVLLTSGYNDHAVGGEIAFLTKPYRRGDLIARLREMFEPEPALTA